MAPFKFCVGLAAAGSLLLGSTAAIAAQPHALAPINPWAALTALSQGAPAATMCGSAVGAAQAAGGCVLPATEAPPPPVAPEAGPPPPVPVPALAAPGAFAFSPLILALIAVAAAAGIYALAKSGGSNSPA